MSILRATAILNKRTGKPEDAQRNVWHFQKLGSAFTDTEVAQIGGYVGNFYAALISWLAASFDPATGAHRVELADLTPGSPGESDDVLSSLRGTTTFTVSGTTANLSLPNQLSVVLSLTGNIVGVPEEAAGGMERPRSRRRGRIYLPTFGVHAMDIRNTTSYEMEVRDPAKEAILDAYDDLNDALIAQGAGVNHGIYSRTDGVCYAVREASVDNVFDTQRRRKIDASDKYKRTGYGDTTAVGDRTGTEYTLAS